MNIQMIPLNQLTLSSDNVRKTGAMIGIAELADSIMAHRLLHNLHVRQTAGGKYEVVAGGRRLAALQMLAAAKSIKKTAAIGCNVLQSEDVTEISLAENEMRLQMHPADQFEAFKKLADEGKGPEDIAARFGTTPDIVRRRMKLAAVSPALIETYRDGKMTLDQLTAFAVSDDHAAQESAWLEMPRYDRSPSSIRRALTNAYVSANDKRALCIGLEAYIAAGGAVIRDLFRTEDGGYLTDSALLDRLVSEKLAGLADEARAEGWKRVEIMPAFNSWGYGRIEGAPSLTVKQQARIDQLSAELAALAGRYDAEEDSEAADALRGEIEALESKIDGITAKRPLAWSREDRARCTAVVCIDLNGQARIERGLIHPDDKKALAAEQRAMDGEQAEAEPPERAAFPARLIETLTGERTAALQAELAANPHVALVAVVHGLALPSLGNGEGSCLRLHTQRVSLRSGEDVLLGQAAADSLRQRHERWLAAVGEAPNLWDWLMAQNTETLLEVLAFCAASSADAVQKPKERQPAKLEHADRLAEALKLDMRKWWQVSGDGYLSHISKARIIDALKEGGAELPRRDVLEGWKKDVLVKFAEEKLAARHWLPAILRSPGETPPESLQEAA